MIILQTGMSKFELWQTLVHGNLREYLKNESGR